MNDQEQSHTQVDEKEDPTTFNKLIKKLQDAGITFQQSTHEAVRTSQQAADIRGSKLENGAKAILIRYKSKDGDKFCLCVMSAVRKLDSKKLRKIINAKSTSFAEESEVRQLTGCIPGAVPPFGSLWDIQTYADQSIDNLDYIDFNAGLRTNSVKMSKKDYVKVEAPIIADITS